MPDSSLVATIVPVYNEEETLSAVLSALSATSFGDEITVVSDGSTDGSAALALELGARVIRLTENHGKGHAMAVGVSKTARPLILFVDGDLRGLDPEKLEALVEPVQRDDLGMHIGLCSRGRLIDGFHQAFGPHLSGIRCLRRVVFESVPARFRRGYRIETAMNWACRELGLGVGTMILGRLEHRLKEEKLGVWPGIVSRVRMFASVFSAYLQLQLERPSSSGRKLPRASAAAIPAPELLPEPTIDRSPLETPSTTALTSPVRTPEPTIETSEAGESLI